jgi:hypothetical protein
MPPRRRAAAGPIPIDVDTLRSALNAGKIVRVRISPSAQFPDGAIGRVRGIGYPAIDGEEFIKVEVNLNGTKDVLPFTPMDLTPATRSRRAAGDASANGNAAGPPPALRPPPAPQRRTPRAPQQAGQIGSPAISIPGQGESHRPSVEPPDVDRPALNGTATSPPRPSDESGTSGVAATDARGKRPRRGQPPVSISISTSENEPLQWRIEARVGARVAVKSTPVQAARVWELVEQLGNELLTTTVGAILEEHRRTTQERADALVAQLEAVRAELDSLPPQSQQR